MPAISRPGWGRCHFFTGWTRLRTFPGCSRSVLLFRSCFHFRKCWQACALTSCSRLTRPMSLGKRAVGKSVLRCCPLSMVMLASCFMSKRTWWCGMLRSTHLSVDGISWMVCHTRNDRHQSQVCGPWAAAERLWWTIWFVKVWSTA